MIVTERMHGSNDGDVVDALGRVREQFRDFNARLPILFEGKRAFQKRSGIREEGCDVQAGGRSFQMAPV